MRPHEMRLLTSSRSLILSRWRGTSQHQLIGRALRLHGVEPHLVWIEEEGWGRKSAWLECLQMLHFHLWHHPHRMMSRSFLMLGNPTREWQTAAKKANKLLAIGFISITSHWEVRNSKPSQWRMEHWQDSHSRKRLIKSHKTPSPLCALTSVFTNRWLHHPLIKSLRIYQYIYQ